MLNYVLVVNGFACLWLLLDFWTFFHKITKERAEFAAPRICKLNVFCCEKKNNFRGEILEVKLFNSPNGWLVPWVQSSWVLSSPPGRVVSPSFWRWARTFLQNTTIIAPSIKPTQKFQNLVNNYWRRFEQR